jgi:hypothetical protein
MIVKIAIKRYRFIYKMGNKEKAIRGIKKVTSFCSSNITGHYYLPALENLLDRIADENLEPTQDSVIGDTLVNHIYHVITEVYTIGGHTRLITNWIINDTANNHHLVLVNQRKSLPDILQNLVKENKITEVIMLDNTAPVLELSKQLRSLLSKANLVVNHMHPDDVTTYLALSNIGENRPVLHMNHADHVFWIGNHVDDLLATYRENTIEKEKKNRGIENVQFLPIVVKKSLTLLSRDKAKNILNIPSDKVMLLTIAGVYKFTPCFQWNYFSAIIDILDKYPTTILYLIGIDKESKFARQYPHERIVYCGYLNNTDLYESAADIYVECFPFPSFTSFLQVSLKGVACQLNHSPINLSRLFPDNIAFTYPSTKKDWEVSLVKLIVDPSHRAREAELQSAYVHQNYADENTWMNKLNKIYSEARALPLAAKRNRKSRFCFDMDEKLKFKVMNRYSFVDPLRILFLK